jgi:hypothetical protein
VTAALAATGYADYFAKSLLSDDELAQACLDRVGDDPINFFLDAFNSGNLSKLDQGCSDIIFGVSADDPDVCSKVSLFGAQHENICGL